MTAWQTGAPKDPYVAGSALVDRAAQEVATEPEV